MTTQKIEPFGVDRMRLDDIPVVMSIDGTAFPIPWPEEAYRHEILDNPNAYFIVIRARQGGDGAMASIPGGRALHFIRRLAGRPARPEIRQVVGFAGMWMFVDEAHISTIATHTGWRGQGVGELMLVQMLREAQRRNAVNATLEVRISNIVAQNLYVKYGFVEVGRRKHYYRDNSEDALIMTVVDFRQPAYLTRLDELEQALPAKLGRIRK